MARPPLTPAGARSMRARSSARRAFSLQQLAGPLEQVRNASAPAVRTDIGWQRDAYAYAASIGEVGYGLHNKANTVGQCRFALERRDENNRWVNADNDPVAQKVAEDFKGPIGGQGELLRAATLHLNIAGECYLLGTPLGGGRLYWEYLSVLEIRIDGAGRVQRLRYGASTPEWVPVDAYIARMHRRDPVNSERADSPMRRVLPICGELVTLTQVVDAIARSRLNAGVWFVPWDVSFGPGEDWENPGSSAEHWDEFSEELEEHFNDPIEDRSSPSSLLPLEMRGPALIGGEPTKDLMGMVDMTRPLDDHYRELREEARARLADGLDWPREIVTGKGNMTHWNANNVDADYLQRHVQPDGKFLADFSTDAYLRPRLRYLGWVENPDDWRWTFDMTEVSARVDTSEGATEAFVADVLAEDAWMRALGLDPADKAPTEERLTRLLLRMAERDPRLAPLVFAQVYPDDPRLDALTGAWPTEVAGGEPAEPGVRRNGDRTVKELQESMRELVDSVATAN